MEAEAGVPGGGVPRPVFASGSFIQTVASQAICVVNNASEERGEFGQSGEFGDPVERHLDRKHEDAFHSACDFLTEYFDGARDALRRENGSYSEWADRVEHEWRHRQHEQQREREPGFEPTRNPS
jgi:hypothetical protein